MTSNTTGKREKAARAAAKKTAVAETAVAETAVAETAVAETEAGTGTDSSILGEIEQNLEFLRKSLKGKRGKAREDLKEWIRLMDECREGILARTLTPGGVEELVRKGCRFSGATPANMISATGDPAVWITHNSDQTVQVNALYAMGERLQEEIAGWKTQQ